MDGSRRPEAAYRQGYVQGVRSLLEALGTHLPDDQTRVLHKWVEGPLTAWSQDDDEAAAPIAPLIDGA